MTDKPTNAEIRGKDAEARRTASACDASEWLQIEPAYVVDLLDRLEAAAITNRIATQAVWELEGKLKAIGEIVLSANALSAFIAGNEYPEVGSPEFMMLTTLADVLDTKIRTFASITGCRNREKDIASIQTILKEQPNE